jgi:hypothetical protein
MYRLFVTTFLAVAFALPAAAQSGPSIDDVRAMAFEKGIVSISEIELDDGIWEIDGTDGEGRAIEMKVDAASGETVKMERN